MDSGGEDVGVPVQMKCGFRRKDRVVARVGEVIVVRWRDLASRIDEGRGDGSDRRWGNSVGGEWNHVWGDRHMYLESIEPWTGID